MATEAFEEPLIKGTRVQGYKGTRVFEAEIIFGGSGLFWFYFAIPGNSKHSDIAGSPDFALLLCSMNLQKLLQSVAGSWGETWKGRCSSRNECQQYGSCQEIIRNTGNAW